MLLTLLGKLIKVGWFEVEDDQRDSSNDEANGQEAPHQMNMMQ